MLEQQVRRMLKHPKAEALAVNFAGQWLNLRGLDATAPLPLHLSGLRRSAASGDAARSGAAVRHHRRARIAASLELLTADYTFVNERLAKHYGIPNIYGSQFRRVTLGPGMDARQGLLGKGAFLATTAKPERTSPVTRGKWVMTNMLGHEPARSAAPTCRRCRRAPADPNAKEPTMRQKMMDHRVRQDCVQCHRLMDPIGFALENFDGIGLWRTARRRHAGRSEGADVRQHADRRAAAAAQLAGHEATRRSVRGGRRREAADLRARPRRRVSRHAARSAPSRATPMQEQRPLLVARAGRRQEPAVPDEHRTVPTHGDEHRERAHRNREQGSQLIMRSSPRGTFPAVRSCKGAGVTLALPLLDAMVPASTALAQTAAGSRRAASSASSIPHGMATRPLGAGG